MVERQGFEPWVGINRRWFSRPVHSTTLPPLRLSALRRGAEEYMKILSKTSPLAEISLILCKKLM